jgi:hypothetical protein
MKKIYFLFFPALISIWMASCKSASKLYDKGNYDEAVQTAIKKLQKDPNDSKAKAVAKDAYRYAVTGHENQIRQYSENDNELKSEWIYNEYAALQNLYNSIFRSPAAFESIKPKDYSSYLNEYGAKAADVHYNKGIKWMSYNDRQSYKTAYHEFQSAMRYKPGDATIEQMLNEAYNAALTRVVIIPANDYGFRYSSYNYQLKNYENDFLRSLQNNTGNEFVKIYSSADAQKLNIIPDEFIEMHFTQINLGKIDDNYSTKEVSRDVVVKEIVYKPDSVVQQFGKVKATITTTKRTIYSEGILTVSGRNNRGLTLWNDKVVGSHSWTTEFSAYTGDERALSDDDKKLLDKAKQNPPKEEETIKSIKENVYGNFISRVRNYYSRY